MIGGSYRIGNGEKPRSTERADPPYPLVLYHTCRQLILETQSDTIRTCKVMSRYGKGEAPSRIH